PRAVRDTEVFEELNDGLAPPCVLAQPQASANLCQVESDLDPDVALPQLGGSFRVAARIVGRREQEEASDAGSDTDSGEESHELQIDRVDLVGVAGLDLRALERERLDLPQLTARWRARMRRPRARQRFRGGQETEAKADGVSKVVRSDESGYGGTGRPDGRVLPGKPVARKAVADFHDDCRQRAVEEREQPRLVGRMAELLIRGGQRLFAERAVVKVRGFVGAAGICVRLEPSFVGEMPGLRVRSFPPLEIAGDGGRDEGAAQEDDSRPLVEERGARCNRFRLGTATGSRLLVRRGIFRGEIATGPELLAQIGKKGWHEAECGLAREDEPGQQAQEQTTDDPGATAADAPGSWAKF